jgi:hypothetical protein
VAFPAATNFGRFGKIQRQFGCFGKIQINDQIGHEVKDLTPALMTIQQHRI